jgi:hypothetical protein
MEKTYWNNQGTYQKEYDRMVNDLVPSMGKCDTVAGELIRAASRLGYDFYNNGMGNNTSGAVNYLDHMGVFDYDNTNCYGTIYEYTRGRVYNGRYEGDALQEAIERMVDYTVQFILENPELETDTNTEDMFDFEDPEQNFCEECGDETDWGYLCSHCEEMQDEEEYDYA